MDISNRGVDGEAKLADRNYIRWDAEGVEKIPENEEDDIKAVADMINTIQRAQWNSHRHCYSGIAHSTLSYPSCRSDLAPKEPTPEPKASSRVN